MGTTTLVACVAVATVFLVSGIAKLTDRDGTRQAVAGFGVPSRLVSLVATVLAPTEIAIALLLLVVPTAVTGLVLALGLLLAFTVAALLALRAGREVECHCFGRIGGADISWRTVARNLVLTGVIVVGLAAAASPEEEVTGGEVAVGVVGGLVLAALVIMVEGWAGRQARVRKQRADEAAFEQGLAAGADSAVPDFTFPTLGGRDASLGSLTASGLPVLLVFMTPGCGPCKAMRPAVARWTDAYGDRVRVAVVSRFGLEQNAAAFAEWPDLEVLVDEEASLPNRLGVVGTPSAVLVGPDGLRRGGTANGERLVRRLLSAALSGDEPDLASAEEPDEGIPVEAIDLDSVVTARSTVTRHGPDDAPVLVDEATGAGATLDQIGGIVWSVLDGTSSLREIVEDLAEAFGTPPEVVGPDVLAMVQSLGRAGLLAGVAAEPPSDAVEHVHETAHVH